MSRIFSALSICGLVIFLTACASTGGRSGNAESAPAQGSLPGAEGWALEEGPEPLPSREGFPPQQDRLAARDFDVARPPQPRNPFDTWENRQFRRIVPPAQR